MNKAITILCSIVICLLVSCKKDSIGVDVNSFYRCDYAQHLDSTGIANKLIGKWRLTLWYCGECYTYGWHYPDKTVIVTFTSSGEFSVTENSTIVTQGNWILRIVDSNKWSLYSTSPLDYLHGYILFCDNQVLFVSSYLDGSDNLFDRLN